MFIVIQTTQKRCVRKIVYKQSYKLHHSKKPQKAGKKSSIDSILYLIQVKMNVVNFLKANSLDVLKSEYSIKVKEYPDQGLIVLNYNTIRTKKSLVGNECRGLILSTDYNVISRAFDRFYNYNECDGALRNNDECYAIEKIDGSLIKIYYFNGIWHVSTRGSAFAEYTVAHTNTSYKQAVFEALSCIKTGDVIDKRAEVKFQKFCRGGGMNIRYSYILELTGKSNRIITVYNPYKYELWFLGIRRNDLVGEYIKVDTVNIPDEFLRPRQFTFTNIKECIEQAKNLQNLQEGFVVYNQTTGEPLLKVKSPTYVIAHNSVTNITDRDICKMMVNGEWTEFVAYFPQHKQKFDEFSEAMHKYFDTAQTEYEELRETMKSNHDFGVFTNKKWKRLAILTFKNNAANLHETFLNWPEYSQIKFLEQELKKK